MRHPPTPTPSSGLVAAGRGTRAGCRAGDEVRGHLFKSSSSPGNKRETYKGDEVAPARTVRGLGPEGRGGSGRTLASRALPEVCAAEEQGRSGAWTLRPQSLHSLDRELEPSGCPGYGLQKFSFVTPCSNCQGCLFFHRSPAGRPTTRSSLEGSRCFPKIKPLQQSVGGMGRGLARRATSLQPCSKLPVKNRNRSLRSAGGSSGPRSSKFLWNQSSIRLYNQSILKYSLNAYFGSRGSLSGARVHLSKKASKGSTKSW